MVRDPGFRPKAGHDANRTAQLTARVLIMSSFSELYNILSAFANRKHCFRHIVEGASLLLSATRTRGCDKATFVQRQTRGPPCGRFLKSTVGQTVYTDFIEVRKTLPAHRQRHEAVVGVPLLTHSNFLLLIPFPLSVSQLRARCPPLAGRLCSDLKSQSASY